MDLVLIEILYRDNSDISIKYCDVFASDNRDISIKYRDVFASDNRDISIYRLNIAMYLLAETSCTP